MYQTSSSKGQELVAQRMVKWFRKLGVDAWLVTSEYHDGERIVVVEDLKILERDPAVGIPTIRVSSYVARWPPRRIMLRNLVYALTTIEKSMGSIDAIITHSTLWNGPVDVATWVQWKRIYRVIDSSREPLPVFAHMCHYQPPDPLRYSSYERAYRIAWNTVLLTSVLRSCDLVLCTTPIEAEDLIGLGASPERIHIYPGGLDDDVAKLIDSAKPDLIIEKFRLPKDKKIIAYLGTIEERKNPLAVVDIAAKLRHRSDIIFVIAGKPGDQWEKVVSRARDLDNVYVLGELSEEEKASLIRASYLNIIMSRMEALGLTQIEFMYGGVPVITSAVYGQRWVVRDGIDGIHVRGPNDVEGAAKAIEMLVDNEDLRNRMSQNARERAKQFLLSKLIPELIDRIKRVREVA